MFVQAKMTVNSLVNNMANIDINHSTVGAALEEVKTQPILQASSLKLAPPPVTSSRALSA
jgi:hypothetical protein